MLNIVFFVTCILLSFMSPSASGHPPTEKKAPVKIAIAQIIKHPSLDLIVEGLVEHLKEEGYGEAQISYYNAQGDLSLAVQGAQSIASERPDLVVAISTSSAQTLKKALKGSNIPLVFGAVTDPLGAKLLKTLEKPEGLITGTIDLPSPEDQVDLILNLVPGLKKIGLIYNPTESNSVFQLEGFKEVLKAKGIEYVEVPASKTSLVHSAATSLLGQDVEAIFFPNDNTVASALHSLLKMTMEAKIPVFASDSESVKEGALAAVANDQKEVGKETGKIVVRLLKGASLHDVPVQKVRLSKSYINEETKKRLGL